MKKFLILIFILSGVVVGCAHDKAKMEVNKKVDVVQKWVGEDSKIKEKNKILITTKQEWKDVWKSHSDKSIPEVNFDAHMVIADFRGEKTIEYVPHAAVELGYITDIGDIIEIQPRNFSSMVSPLGSPRTIYPYGIFVLPRIDKPIHFIHNTKKYKTDPDKIETYLILDAKKSL